LESNWRMNVLLYDGSLGPWEYFARLVNPEVYPYNYLIKARGFENVYLGYVAGEQFQYYTGGALPPAAHPHFPWGYDVEPD